MIALECKSFYTCKSDLYKGEIKQFKRLNHFDSADNEVPLITCAKNQSRNTEEGQETAMVIWEDPVATDNSGQISSIFCMPRSGNDFKIGQTLVTCEANDKSGNTATCSFQVIVTAAGNYLNLYKIH